MAMLNFPEAQWASANESREGSTGYLAMHRAQLAKYADRRGAADVAIDSAFLADCLSTAKTWFWDVSDACSDGYINVSGRLIPPYTIPERIQDSMNIACLRPGTDVSMLPGIGG
ncbi:hypothetical protein MGYG_02301 [Nannizzia gypsea CBS 118893]|uniref:Uncharacterized protein n=1 Tax=Arthroderma gypseum (strain ATCC MYA-4604 / CBS 118893) TaxID=535722 RepID=E4UQW4_ARTGP|nr:hypothetical protein MGYG_02301 [Nannizzia gypsea CBS 118893]EFQ99290.1 hypothetical protein MGYG_02301 [Nannizzia gypsea CBS 118893]